MQRAVVGLVRIKNGAAKAPLAAKLDGGPLVDKFFLLGALSGFFGTAYLGIHLWLMRNGLMTPWLSYHDLKFLHALIQNNLFFGLFVLGFTFQAGPKLFEVKRSQPSSAVLLCAISPVIGTLLLYVYPSSFIGKFFVAAPFAIAVLFCSTLLFKASPNRRIFIGVPFLIGLVVLGVSPFVSLSDPSIGICLIWGGIVPVILAAAQQFMSGFLGGVKAERLWGWLFLSCFIASLLFLLLWEQFYLASSAVWRVFGALSLLTLLFYLQATRAWKIFAMWRLEPLPIAFIASFSWALLGAVLVILDRANADDVLHLWATGWGVTLTLALSAQIIGYLSGKPILKEKSLALLLIVWQAVPLGRGVSRSVGVSFSWAVALVTSIVFAVWVVALVRGIIRIGKRQAALQSGQIMVRC